jgi:hypothetical protein
MMISDRPAKLYSPEEAEANAQILQAGDPDGELADLYEGPLSPEAHRWTYEAIHDPKGTGWSFIVVHDEDGYLIGKM